MEFNDKFKPENDIELWFRDTYVIWTMANFNAYRNFCGTEFNLDNAKDCKLYLSRDWNVETKEELIELANSLCDFIVESGSLLNVMKERDEQNYNETLDFVAWDLCRGTQVLGMGFVSEIIDRETMVEESSKIAYFMQTYFTSWDDLISHYLNGYQEWALDTYDTNDANQAIQLRRILHDTFKATPSMGCYQIDWNLPIYEMPEFTIISKTLLEENEENSSILKKYNGNSSIVTVPDGITKIGVSAFEGNDYIQEVILPNSVKYIEGQAFLDCSNLSKINLPESVIEIGEACFWGCTSLESITLPSNLQKLDTSALGGNGLISCTIPESITHLLTTFYKCHNLKEVILPETLKFIGESSFQHCVSLCEITIPESVEFIGVQAFADCPNLEKLNCDNPQFKFKPNTFENSPLENMFAHLSGDEEDDDFGFNINGSELIEFTDYKSEEVVIPDNIFFICDEAFKNKTKLKKVVIPKNVRVIGANLFEGCTSLEEIVFESDEFFHIGENAFTGTPWFENLSDEFNILKGGYLIKYTGNQEFVTVPESVKEIVAPAFPENIVGVSFPITLKVIGAYAFDGCKNLKEMVIPDNVNTVGRFAFHECTALESIILPKSLEILEQNIFNGCTSLINVTLPTEVDDIENSVFKDTPFWESLTDEFTIISDQLLKYNGGENAIIPNSVVKIGGTAFANNKELISVVIPDSVEKIGVSAFVNCENLERVEFGDSVEEICTSAFLNTGLKSITLPNSLEVITEMVFGFCKQLEKVEISDSVKLIECRAFIHCEKLAEITIPQTLEIIEGGAFAECKSLEKLNVLNENLVALPMAFDGTKISEEQLEELMENYNEYLKSSQNSKNSQNDDDIYKVQLLARVTDLNDVVGYVVEALDDVLLNVEQQESNVIFELKDGSNFILTISELTYNQAMLEQYKSILIEKYAKIETDKEKVKNGLLDYLNIVNAVFVLSFEQFDIEERLVFLLNSCLYVTSKTYGVMLMNDNSFVDGQGNTVFTEDGVSDLDTFSTLFPADSLPIEQEEPTMEDDMRYLTSREHLKSKDIPVMEEFMALSLRKSSVKLRSVEQICERIVALYTVAIYTECQNNEVNEEISIDGIIECITNIYNSDDYYTELEDEFMNEEEVSQESLIQFSWSYECVGMLLWVVGLFDTNNEPNAVYSPEQLTTIIQEYENLEEMISQAELRPIDELLLEQDLYMRYHWACIEARINEEQPAGNMITSSVMERHKALNWVLTDIFGDDWDDVHCPA